MPKRSSSPGASSWMRTACFEYWIRNFDCQLSLQFPYILAWSSPRTGGSTTTPTSPTVRTAGSRRSSSWRLGSPTTATTRISCLPAPAIGARSPTCADDGCQSETQKYGQGRRREVQRRPSGLAKRPKIHPNTSERTSSPNRSCRINATGFRLCRDGRWLVASATKEEQQHPQEPD